MYVHQKVSKILDGLYKITTEKLNVLTNSRRHTVSQDERTFSRLALFYMVDTMQ